jgi:hypothetical protein
MNRSVCKPHTINEGWVYRLSIKPYGVQLSVRCTARRRIVVDNVWTRLIICLNGCGGAYPVILDSKMTKSRVDQISGHIMSMDAGRIEI